MALVIDFNLNLGQLITIVIVTVVALFLTKFIRSHFQHRKIDRIINSYKSKGENTLESNKNELEKPVKKAIPFTKREKKIGLT